MKKESKIEKLQKRIAQTEDEIRRYEYAAQRRNQEPDPSVLQPVQAHLDRLNEQLQEEMRKSYGTRCY